MSKPLPVPQNKPVEIVDDVIHSVIMKVAVAAAIKAATANFPFLALPVVSTIFKWTVNFLFGKFDKYMQQAVAFRIIDGQVNAEVAACQKAEKAMREGQPDADKDFEAALAKLIHFDGSGLRNH